MAKEMWKNGQSLARCLMLSLAFLCSMLDARRVGSNTVSTRQYSAFFPASDPTNELCGFSAFEQGFILEDATTSVAFNAFFPLSGDIVLNGGTLNLSRDLTFKSPLFLGVGTINGNSYAIEFPGNVLDLNIPSANSSTLLAQVDQTTVSDRPYSIDWSFDDQYLAVSTAKAKGDAELKIYYFDGMTLTVTASVEFNTDVQAVRWHPSDHYLAVGKSSGIELELYYLDVASGNLTPEDTNNTGAISALAWTPDGQHIAVGLSNSSAALVYPVTAGSFGSVISYNFSANRRVHNNAVDWDSTGQYLALGLEKNSSDGELQVLYFNGASLVAGAESDVGADVYAVGWKPGTACVAVGLGGESERFRLYAYDAVHSSLSQVAYVGIGERRGVYDFAWNEQGTLLLEGRLTDKQGHELRLLSFDTDLESFRIVSGIVSSYYPNALRWSWNQNYIAVADSGENITVFSLADHVLNLNSVKLFFNSDVTFTNQLRFAGQSVINGGGNILTLDTNGSLVATEGATLRLENAIIKGLSGNKIHCVDDDGVLLLRDLVMVLDGDVTFSTGAIYFKNDTKLYGEDTTFAYQTAQTSTLVAKSKLVLDEGVTFSYDPLVVARKDLLEFEDETALLILDGATLHATVTGMQLTKGKLKVKDDSSLSSEVQVLDDGTTIDEGITFGDNSLDADFHVEILAGETLTLLAGSINYKNVSSSSFGFGNLNSYLYLRDGTRINLYQSLHLEPGYLLLGAETIIGRDSGKIVTGSVRPQAQYLYAGVP